MSFSTSFSSSKAVRRQHARKAARRKAPHTRSRLCVELLEDRVVPSTLTTVASFGYTHGALPYAGVVEDSSGNLFGTAYSAAPMATARCSRWRTAAARHESGLLQRHQRGPS